jgi:hypothetical protein
MTGLEKVFCKPGNFFRTYDITGIASMGGTETAPAGGDGNDDQR